MRPAACGAVCAAPTTIATTMVAMSMVAMNLVAMSLVAPSALGSKLNTLHLAQVLLSYDLP